MRLPCPLRQSRLTSNEVNAYYGRSKRSLRVGQRAYFGRSKTTLFKIFTTRPTNANDSQEPPQKRTQVAREANTSQAT